MSGNVYRYNKVNITKIMAVGQPIYKGLAENVNITKR